MIIDSIVAGAFHSNCYLIAEHEGDEGIIIDPGDDGDAILQMAARHRTRIIGILMTHGHIDHIAAADAVRKATGAPLYLSPADQPLFENLPLQASAFGSQADKIPGPIEPLSDGRNIVCGQLNLRIIETPGHSPGSVCIFVDGSPGVLFSGDTLFAGGIGRTDLWGGSYRQLLEMIRTKVLSMDDRIRVLPGHGEATTIGDERMNNPFLQDIRR